MAERRHWLLKTEPSAYAYDQLELERRTAWTGIRNFEARNHLRAMHPGDLLLCYHTGEEKAVVGVAQVLGEPGPDATAPGEDWASVDVAPLVRLKTPVTLARIKNTPALREFALIRRSRLSVVPVSPAEFAAVLEMGETRLPDAVRTPRSPAGR